MYGAGLRPMAPEPLAPIPAAQAAFQLKAALRFLEFIINQRPVAFFFYSFGSLLLGLYRRCYIRVRRRYIFYHFI